MANFSKISETNEVLTVLTLNNSDMLNADGVETESIGQAYLEQHNNWPSHLWIQTSYNTQNNKYKNQDGTEGDLSKAFRGNYPRIHKIINIKTKMALRAIFQKHLEEIIQVRVILGTKITIFFGLKNHMNLG